MTDVIKYWIHPTELITFQRQFQVIMIDKGFEKNLGQWDRKIIEADAFVLFIFSKKLRNCPFLLISIP